MSGNENFRTQLFLQDNALRYHTSQSAMPPPSRYSYASSLASSPPSSSGSSEASSSNGGDMRSQYSASSVGEPFDYRYSFPCEFGSICEVRFGAWEFESFLLHSLTHFCGYGPPSKSVCTFCDREFNSSSKAADALRIWRRRMEHISDHFRDRRTHNHSRPDFWTLEHLHSVGGMTTEDYIEATSYSERPKVDNTFPLGYRPQEMALKEERNSRTNHNLEKENRQRDRELKSGKHKSKEKTHRHRS